MGIKQMLGTFLPAPSVSFHDKINVINDTLSEIQDNLNHITNGMDELRWAQRAIRLKPGNEISTVISPNDKMFIDCEYDAALRHYMFTSATAMECILQALDMAKKAKANSILDFPCGHGRVLRSLTAYFPDAHITACDLEKDAVDFCVKTFNVSGVYSDIDVSKINLGRKFDLIWCGSLFTHLDEKTFGEFFDFLVDNLEEDGLLVFTVHGRYSLSIVKDNIPDYPQMLKQVQTHGFGFISDDYVIDGDYTIPDYGGTFVSMSYITSMIQKDSNIRLIYYSENRYADNQDVVVIQKKSIEVV